MPAPFFVVATKPLGPAKVGDVLEIEVARIIHADNPHEQMAGVIEALHQVEPRRSWADRISVRVMYSDTPPTRRGLFRLTAVEPEFIGEMLPATEAGERHRAQLSSLEADLMVARLRIERLEGLLADSREQCESRTAQLQTCEAQFVELAHDAATGRLFFGVLAEIERARTMQVERPHDFPPDWSPLGIAKVIGGELLEVRNETPYSAAARRESGDVGLASLHLIIAHRGSVLHELSEAGDRMRKRLDVMERGGPGTTWAAAKSAVG